MDTYGNLTDREILEILSLSPKAIAVYTTQDIIIQSANDAMITFWGKDRTIIGKPLEEAVPELKGQPFIGLLQNVLKTGITNSGRAIPAELMSNGKLQIFYYDYEYRAIKDEHGVPYCVMHTAEDVTALVLSLQKLEIARQQEEQLELEQGVNEQLATANEELNAINEELQQTQENLQLLNAELEERVLERTKALFESESNMRYMIAEAPIAIAVFKGRDLIIDTANEKVLEAWGKTVEIIGKPLQVGVPELHGQDFLNILDEVFVSGIPFYGNEVKALIEKNQVIEEIYSNFVYQPLKNEQGQTTHIMLIAHLVTEQVMARKKAEDAEEMLRVSIEAANAGTWYLDTHTHEFRASPRLKELFGFSGNETVSYEAVTARIPEDYRLKVKAGVKRTIETGENYYIEHPILSQNDQKQVWVSAIGKLYTNNSGNPLHFSGMILDITQQKEDEIRKNDFIGMVSHELKTPLTSLSGYIQLLHRNAKKAADNYSADVLQKATGQLKKMTGMINGFLNISRLESGKIHLQKQQFDMDALVQELIGETKLSASGHTITFLPCPPLNVFADKEKIGSVISNLLSNAVKYSPHKEEITVHCELVGDQVQVSIKDEGLGINQSDTKRLFERFYRVENKENPHISGFGIGLYLSAEIIEHHGGKIWVESEKGKGSTFHFSIPVSGQ
ncbi:ATP-binding protein [Pedobacter metabolipauper]|uniref:histidine kinase n=1 Tax=Pedobacter metabolipauper TaxID=425513 RepID=A0A4R6T0J4_9SPHI|nr:ATP-binding protein [Pedobacter metabolipauper]TDQ11549.1 two-component system CheB/CheR fusion protein [Pedobacter metabolipauper]